MTESNVRFKLNTTYLEKAVSSYCSKIIRCNDFVVCGVSLPWEPVDNTLIYIKYAELIDNELIKRIEKLSKCVIILPETSTYIPNNDKNIIIKSELPKWDFASILTYVRNVFSEKKQYKAIGNGVMIAEDSFIGGNVKIEPNVVIENDVLIGQGSQIMSGVVIRSGSIIGENVIIGTNSVIGGDEMDLAENERGDYLLIPHMYGVKIGDNVIIGPTNIIPAGVFNPTTIGDNVVTSGMTEIGHGAIIGKGTKFAGGATICGCVEVGENCWIGPKSVVIDRVKIGNNSRIGIGAVVMRAVGDNEEVLGNPARKVNFAK